MLSESNYTYRVKQLFTEQKNLYEWPDVPKDLSDSEIVQFAFCVAARRTKAIFQKTGDFKDLKVPGRLMYTCCDLSPENSRLRGQNVIIMGTTGTGKTYLSVKLTKDYFCSQYIPTRYRESPDFFEGIYAQGTTSRAKRKIVYVTEQMCLDMFSRKIEKQTAFDRYKSYDVYGAWNFEDLYDADLLVIQDLGSASAHPAFASKLFSVLDERILDISKQTIFTTNKSMSNIKEKYGEMFTDRLKLFSIVKKTGESKRNNIITKRTTPKFEFFTGDK